MEATLQLFDKIVNPTLWIRRITISANQVIPESQVKEQVQPEQLNLFTDYVALEKEREQEQEELEREKRMQEMVLSIKNKFGKNAILRGMNLQEGATARNRNKQIGGHRA